MSKAESYSIVGGASKVECPLCRKDIRGSSIDAESHYIAHDCGATITLHFAKDLGGYEVPRIQSPCQLKHVRPLTPQEVIDLWPDNVPDRFTS